MRPNKRKVQFWRRIQRTQTRNSTVGLPGAPLKLSPPLLLNTLDDVLKHVSLVARTAVAVPSSIKRSQLRPPARTRNVLPRRGEQRRTVASHGSRKTKDLSVLI